MNNLRFFSPMLVRTIRLFVVSTGRFVGAGSQIFYLQTALAPAELDKITLIGDIPEKCARLGRLVVIFSNAGRT